MSAPSLAEISNPEAWGYGAALGNLLLKLAPAPDRPIVTETAPMQAPRLDTGVTPEDFRPEFGDVHSQTNFTGGEGLLHRFRRNPGDNDPIRFFDSTGVDPSPRQGGRLDELRLLPTTELVEAVEDGPVRVAAAGDTVWVTDGETLRKTTDITATVPSFSDDDPHASETAVDVEDVAVSGGIPYVALGSSGIHRDDGGWAHWSDVEAVRVWSVLDRIVASDGTALYEAASTTTSVLLYTLPDGDVWTDVVDAAGAIVAGATNGFVYVFGLNDDGDLEVVSQTRLMGESPVALAARGPLLWVAAKAGDELRLWQAEVAGGVVGDLSLVREWSGCGCSSATSTRDRIYVGVTEGDVSHLWQVELSTFGIFRGMAVGEGPVQSIVTVGDIVVAGVAGEGVRRQTGTLEDFGYLIGPLSDFFRADLKSWVTGWADVTVAPGEKVELYYTTARGAMSDPDDPRWVRVRTYSAPSSSVERSLGNVQSRHLAGMVRLTRSPANTSPTVRTVAFRAYPSSGDVIVQLPVDVGDQQELHGRRRSLHPGWGQTVIMPKLRELESRSTLCRLYATGELIRGMVEKVSTPVPAVTVRGSRTQVSIVTLRGRRVSQPDLSISVGGWGAWGNFQWGAGQWGGVIVDGEDL